MPRLPDWSSDEERFQESRSAAADAQHARRIARKALRDGDPTLATAAAKVYDTLTGTALKLATHGRPVRKELPTADELKRQLGASGGRSDGQAP